MRVRTTPTDYIGTGAHKMTSPATCRPMRSVRSDVRRVDLDADRLRDKADREQNPRTVALANEPPDHPT